jgi:mitotic spindle assembly checkpoint protein MAD2
MLFYYVSSFNVHTHDLLTAWLEEGCLRQLVLVITEAGTQEVLERWTFDIDTNKDVISGAE